MLRWVNVVMAATALLLVESLIEYTSQLNTGDDFTPFRLEELSSESMDSLQELPTRFQDVTNEEQLVATQELEQVVEVPASSDPVLSPTNGGKGKNQRKRRGKKYLIESYTGANPTHPGQTRAESVAEKRPNARLFVFQTSGGFNNQRIILMRALRICKIMDRVCLIPMAGRHSSMFKNYNKIEPEGLMDMDRVLDFRLLRSYGAKFAPMSTPFSQFEAQLREKIPVDEWFIVEQSKEEKKLNPVTMQNLTEWSARPERVIYFAGPTMWQKFAKKFEEEVFPFVNYTPFFRAAALDVVKALGLKQTFACIHSRQSDHGEKWEKWMEDRQDPEKSSTSKPVPAAKFTHAKGFSTQYLPSEEALEDPGGFLARELNFLLMERQLPRNAVRAVYVATKPSPTVRLTYQNLTKEFKTFFSADMPQEVLSSFDAVFDLPTQARLRNDMLGVVEQLICARSVLFVGFKGSSFSEYISQLRKEPLKKLDLP